MLHLYYLARFGFTYIYHDLHVFSYVHDNYFPYRSYRAAPPSSTAPPPPPLNWVTYVYDRGVDNYVPMELIHGAIQCGMNFALYAMDAPPDIQHKLHADFSEIPGVLGLPPDVLHIFN